MLHGVAAVHGVAKSRTRLSDWTELNTLVTNTHIPTEVIHETSTALVFRDF